MTDKYTEIDGKFYQECDLIMLITTNDKSPALFLGNDGRLSKEFRRIPSSMCHLYFLSDEETRSEICWHYNHILKTISNEVSTGYKKIIATTNSELNTDKRYKDGGEIVYLLPRPSNSFVDKFVSEWNKGNKIEKVLVEYYDLFPVSNKGVYYKVKVAPDNTTTIKPIEVRESWSREEVINILRIAWFRNGGRKDSFDIFIDQNL